MLYIDDEPDTLIEGYAYGVFSESGDLVFISQVREIAELILLAFEDSGFLKLQLADILARERLPKT